MRRLTQQGFTYLTILFVVAMLGAGLALAGEVWRTAAQRDKEVQLIFVGREYRKAIERYYLAGQGVYPRNLDDLLKDPRRAETQRYLRKRYPDPITGKAEWGVIKAPDGGIMGVHSLSEAAPLKVANFRASEKGFDNREKYSDWQFVFLPQQTTSPKPAPKSTPAATPTPPVAKP